MGRKAYSQDLRIRVVQACEAKQGTYREIASVFSVGLTALVEWVKRSRQGLGLEPGHGGGKPRIIGVEHEPAVRKIIETHPDATLDVLIKLVQEELELAVSRTTMCRTMARMRITIKKNASRRRTRQSRRPASAAKLSAGAMVQQGVADDLCGRMRSESIDDPDSCVVRSRKKGSRKRAQELG